MNHLELLLPEPSDRPEADEAGETAADGSSSTPSAIDGAVIRSAIQVSSTPLWTKKSTRKLP